MIRITYIDYRTHLFGGDYFELSDSWVLIRNIGETHPVVAIPASDVLRIERYTVDNESLTKEEFIPTQESNLNE